MKKTVDLSEIGEKILRAEFFKALRKHEDND